MPALIVTIPLMRIFCALALMLCGCDAPMEVLRPDAGPMTDSGRRTLDAATEQTLGPGVVEGTACGFVSVLGSIEIAAATTLTVCAGSTLAMAPDAAITVRGTLLLEGTAGARIQIVGEDQNWAGMTIEGTLEADFVDVYNATQAISGAAGSTIRFDDGTITAFGLASLTLANGGTLDRTTILGGNSVVVTGGMLSMTDSVIDLDMPGLAPDCTHFAGGGATLDHVRITGCHCPLHFAATNTPVTVTASILDGAAVPVMIANTTAEIHGNVIDGTGVHFEDIGGGITANVSDNYYAGATPRVSTDVASQFTGLDSVLSAAPAGVGPR